MRYPLAALALSLAAGAPAGYAQTLHFSNQTQSTGVISEYISFSGTLSLPIFLYAGGATGDFDRDGDLDVFLLSGGHEPDHLYINNGDGTFTDEAESWGVALEHLGGGASVADYDNDGDLDIFVTSMGTDPLDLLAHSQILYRNNGDHTFTNVAAQAGVQTTSPDRPDGFGSAWGDYDMDGDLDLLVGGWSDVMLGERLFRNNADGTFTDVTADITPLLDIPMWGFTPTFHDMDGDGYPEILWAADFVSSQYLINNQGQSFTLYTLESGTGLDQNGMGATTADFNHDGLPDWYVSAIETVGGNKLYLNNGDHTYNEVSVAAGVNQGAWGWGVAAVDLDNDADMDIVETNGYALWDNPSKIFLNNNDGTFTESAAALGLFHQTQGRGIIKLDYDNDGDVDLVFLSHHDPAFLFRNDLTKDTGANWLRLQLDNCGSTSLTPDGVGAHIEVTAGGLTQHQWITAAPSYLAQGELVAHFGLAQNPVADAVRITWPNGYTRVLTDVPADQTIEIIANLADLATPYGVLDYSDVQAFLIGFASQDQAADLAPPSGVFDFSDVFAFLTEFAAGCR
ncbi:MAG: CRTAC1 family protein [Phycisphaerales bacterium]